ncbi:hypothetical protein HPP92_020133 [Vanilla planifolia]|uniref:Uncharacterized protein n=1 Tax=Vanilla planifolia TaxID=51239 RepID=A0A835UJZ6_VANPL|nr:hypothetical protein HPP92_020133 [Vanilla planifolia]
MTTHCWLNEHFFPSKSKLRNYKELLSCEANYSGNVKQAINNLGKKKPPPPTTHTMRYTIAGKDHGGSKSFHSPHLVEVVRLKQPILHKTADLIIPPNLANQQNS